MTDSRWVRLVGPVAWRAINLAGRLKRGMTLGVRAVVFDWDGRVFLVRHGYVPGYHLPGGAVDRGESAEAAIVRELREEGNLTLSERPVLAGFYFQRRLKVDHVALYVVRGAGQTAPVVPNREIREAGFFVPDALPDGTTAPTRRRIAEIVQGLPPDAEW